MWKRIFRSFIILFSFTVIFTGTFLTKDILLVRSQENPVKGNQSIGQASEVEISVDEVVAGGFLNPDEIVNAGDGSGRLFVLEQAGRIMIIKNGVVLAKPFLDIQDKVLWGGERGLVGLAFHPNYESNGYFYIFYTRTPDGTIMIVRYKVSTNPDVAKADSAYTLMKIPHPLPIHNGGKLVFGPDNKLYIGLGDGDEQGDPANNSQNLEVFYGKILRIDTNGSPYKIPADNPFVGKPGNDEIWVYGLRNPWRFSFDRGTRDLWIGDVGYNNWEEIDYRKSGQAAGINFGWRCKEASHILYPNDPTCSNPQFLASVTDPLVEYSHSEGNSVTGGFVYRGKVFPDLQGFYFYGDFINGKIWSLYQNQLGEWSTPRLMLDTELGISSIGEDENGELYVVDYNGGTVRRLSQKVLSQPDISDSWVKASTSMADPGEVITYTIQLINNGVPSSNLLNLTNLLPAGLNYLSDSMQASSGLIDDSSNPMLRWFGDLTADMPVTITYQAQVKLDATGSQVTRIETSGDGYPAGLFKHALQIPRPVLQTTVKDFFLPGTQPNVLQEPITLPGTCDVCHTAPIYNQWRGSMMSQAGHDPLFWAALEVANHDVPNSGEYCLRCHSSKGWLEGRSQPADGSSLTSYDLGIGVSCALCHRTIEPLITSNDESSERDQAIRTTISPSMPVNHVGSAMLVIDPLDYRRGPFSLGVNFAYHPNQTFASNFLGNEQSDFIARSRLCGSCHNVENPALSWDTGKNQYWINEQDTEAPGFDQAQLYPVETTYDEWLNSDYAKTGIFAPEFSGSKADGIVGACTDCHMLRSTGTAADGSFNPVFRDCTSTGCLPIHSFNGGNTWIPELLQNPNWRLNSLDSVDYLNNSSYQASTMLRRAASMVVGLEQIGDSKVATVRIINQTGHKLPTGYAEGRRMWINLKAFDGQGNLVYESGAYDFLTGELVLDPDIRIYEVHQALTQELANVLNLPSGASFHFVLNNTVEKDNRIPPRGYTQAAFDKPGLKPVGAFFADGQYWDEAQYILPRIASYVIVTLYYQTASKDYIDFLEFNGGLDSQTLAEMWDVLKSPPVDMMTVLAPSQNIYMPVVGNK
jgi:uncharacterized repeat protein (TIGR01451 family)